MVIMNMKNLVRKVKTHHAVILALSLFIVILSGCVPTETSEQQAPVQPESSGGEVVSSALLAEHNSAQSCWVAYDGEVYDVTSWLSSHPGGAQAILPYCGTAEEFERAFSRQHGEQQVQTLEQQGVYIGTLE